MKSKLIPPTFDVLSFLPKNFFNKDVNEKFIKLVMESVLGDGNWQKGKHELKEPDYIFNNIPLEFTLASDKCNKNNKNNFINKLRTITYTTNNSEDDLICYIQEQIEEKSKKQYSLSNVHLCVLCLIEQFDWVSDKYGSYTHCFTNHKRELFFKYIKSKYVDTKVFSNIFIIFPDLAANWWVWDILSDNKVSLQVTPYMIESRDYPYFIEKRLYVKLVNDGYLKDIFNIVNRQDN